MTQPKAKWSECYPGVWVSKVGPFLLSADAPSGECHIDVDGAAVWTQRVATPCDIPDLMRLTEAELARRLEGAAETMDGRELVAEEQQPSAQIDTSPTNTTRLRDDAGGFSGPLALTSSDRIRAFRQGAKVEFVCGCVPVDCAFVDGENLMVVAVDVKHERLFLCRPGADTGEWVDQFNAKIPQPTLPVQSMRVEVDKLVVKPLAYPKSCGIELQMPTADDTCGHGDCGDCLPATECPRRVTKAAEFLTARNEPRFKVGELVRTICGHILPVVAVGVGKVRVRRSSVGHEYDMVPESLSPYTLPPINSYADLADVLDELPEGWRVERTIAGYSRSSINYRIGNNYVVVTSMKSMWTREEGLKAPYDRSAHRVLPPENRK